MEMRMNKSVLNATTVLRKSIDLYENLSMELELQRAVSDEIKKGLFEDRVENLTEGIRENLFLKVKFIERLLAIQSQKLLDILISENKDLLNDETSDNNFGDISDILRKMKD